MKNQKRLKRILDLGVINKLPVNRFYILDASAVLKDPYIEKYSKTYNSIKQGSCFIVTIRFLKEIDDASHKNRERPAFLFMKNLLELCKRQKLSEAVLMKDTQDYLYYYPHDLGLYECDKYKSFPDDYTDKQLLCFAMQLKELKKEVSIITNDILLQILCIEEGINPIYIPSPEPDIKTASGPAKIAIINESNKNIQDSNTLNPKSEADKND